MSDSTPRPEFRVVTPEEHEEVVESLAQQFRQFADDITDGDGIGDGLDDMSEDAFMQELQDASRLLEQHGVPREERADYIIPALHAGMYRNMARELGGVEQQIRMMFEL